MRRKLRRAKKSGVTDTRCDEAPWRDLHAIDEDLQARNGAARGLSMGRFCPGYLRGHHIYITRLDFDIVGFPSFLASAKETCLDLLRTRHSAPHGTLHMLVQNAITDAAKNGYRRFSLAALPRQASTESNLLRRLAMRILWPGNAEGLTRFKTCFAPRLQPLYAVAPHSAALALGLADLGWAIRRVSGNTLHDDHEENTFAPLPQT